MSSRKEAKRAGDAMKTRCEVILKAMVPHCYNRLQIEVSLESFWYGFWPWQWRHRIILYINFTERGDFLKIENMLVDCVTRHLHQPENAKFTARIHSRLIQNSKRERTNARTDS